MSDFRAAIAVFALVMGLVLGGALLLARTNCNVIAEESGVAVEWRVIGGCFIEMEDGRFVPQRQWRVNEDGGL